MPTSIFFSLQPTPYGGRGLYATQDILQGTLLHTCDSPYASVIFHAFRKEVCANCFAYAFDVQRSAWNIKLDDGYGVWFCSASCKEAWVREQNVGGLLTLMYVAVDKLAKTMWKAKVESTLLPVSAEGMTQATLDRVWKNAERSQYLTIPGLASKTRLDVVHLDRTELETARFMISAIVRRHIEETAPLDAKPTRDTWAEFLELQNNELVFVRQRPQVLNTQLRIYAFLRRVLVPELQEYVATSEMVRAVFGRDEGNAFGLWEASPGRESEMFGWGMYVSGSFFNHNCAPNVRKERVGRAFHFYAARDVPSGEELCINYIDVQDEVKDRKAQLMNSWYFDCVCERCERELLLVDAGGP